MTLFEAVERALDTGSLEPARAHSRNARASQVCASCKKPAVKFRDALSAKEYTLSGLCQECQDGVFGGPEPE